MGNVVFIGEVSMLSGNHPKPVTAINWSRGYYVNKIHRELKNLYIVINGEVVSERLVDYMQNPSLEQLIDYIEVENSESTVAYYSKSDFDLVNRLLHKERGWALVEEDTPKGTFVVHCYTKQP